MTAVLGGQQADHPRAADRGEVLGSIVLIVDLDVEALLAQHAQLHEADRVKPYDGPEAFVEADFLFRELDVEIVD